MSLRFAWLWLVSALGVLGFPGGNARGAEKADGLLRLVPPDAGITLVVEDLAAHAREFLGSPLATGLKTLPAVQKWLASARFREFESARRKIEQAIGEKFVTVRDELLGEVFVLALYLPENHGLDDARGLLLTHVSNSGLLQRAIKVFNDAQRRELTRLSERSWHGKRYVCREFRQPNRPSEYYLTLDDRVFAWSNSESLIQGVIDRGTREQAGLTENAGFRRIRERLPQRALASVFINPKFLDRVVNAAPPKEGGAPVPPMLVRYLRAVEYAGLSLECHDGLLVQTEERLNPARLDPWIKAWAGKAGKVDPALERLPASAVAVATLPVDFVALLEAIEGLAPPAAQQQLRAMLEVGRGVMLGRDVRAEILPNLGPGAVAYVEPPHAGDSKAGLPMAVAVQVSDSGVSQSLENAMRTVLALSSLDANRRPGHPPLTSHEIARARITSLERASPFAFAVEPGRIAIGSSAESLARLATAGNHERLGRARSRYFPDAESFVWLDLRAIYEACHAARAELVEHLAAEHRRSEDAQSRDLEHVLALMHLFQEAYLTSEVSADASTVRHRLGLIVDDAGAHQSP